MGIFHRIKKSDLFEKKDRLGTKIYIYLVLIIFTVIAIYPILNILTIALRPGDQVFSTSLRIIPKNATLDNFYKVFFEKPILRWIWNSTLVSGTTTIFSLFFASLTGYAFSRFKFRGRKTLMTMIMANQMFPIVMILIPLNLIIINVGLSGKLQGLIIPYIASNVPFTALLLKGYFDTIPFSLEESAYVDGAGVFYTYFRIIMPLSKPALAVGGIFCFLGGWTEFIVARIIIRKEALYTLPLGLTTMQQQFTTQWGMYSAGALITSIPVMIAFVILSKYIVGGLTVGSIKE